MEVISDSRREVLIFVFTNSWLCGFRVDLRRQLLCEFFSVLSSVRNAHNLPRLDLRFPDFLITAQGSPLARPLIPRSLFICTPVRFPDLLSSSFAFYYSAAVAVSGAIRADFHPWPAGDTSL